jgi:hypothetical protein
LRKIDCNARVIIARVRQPRFGVIRRRKDRRIGRCSEFEGVGIILDDDPIVGYIGAVQGIAAGGSSVGLADGDIRRQVCVLLGRGRQVAGIERATHPTDHGDEQKPLATYEPHGQRACFFHD